MDFPRRRTICARSRESARRRVHALALMVTVVVALVASAGEARAQARPAESPRVAPADEITLDEPAALRAVAIQSRMSAILANFALLQRQAQDLQTELARTLAERTRLLEEAARRSRVEVREPTEWAYDEPNRRFVRARRSP